jgi:hypothetical protein
VPSVETGLLKPMLETLQPLRRKGDVHLLVRDHGWFSGRRRILHRSNDL